jgi:plastocyanin
MKSKFLACAVATLFVVAGAAPVTAEVVIDQKAKKFDKKKIEIKKGETVKFVNSDTIAHNIHSRSAGNKFDLGVSKPGTSTSKVFDKAGKFKVRCAIHPKMKLTVTVN